MKGLEHNTEYSTVTLGVLCSNALRYAATDLSIYENLKPGDKTPMQFYCNLSRLYEAVNGKYYERIKMGNAELDNKEESVLGR